MIIVGAGGHARELFDVLLDNQYEGQILFFDDISEINALFSRIKVLKSKEEVLNSSMNFFCVGVGNPILRFNLHSIFLGYGLKPKSIISKNAQVSEYALVSEGVNIMPFSSVTNGSSIGRGSLVHYHSSVHHDVVVGDFCEISPGARLLGGCSIGEKTSIGTNAVVLPKIKIGSNCVVGAGAVVTKNIADGSIVKGVPAK